MCTANDGICVTVTLVFGDEVTPTILLYSRLEMSQQRLCDLTAQKKTCFLSLEETVKYVPGCSELCRCLSPHIEFVLFKG